MSDLTSEDMRRAARSLRKQAQVFICFAALPDRRHRPGALNELHALLIRDGFAHDGTFDRTWADMSKQERRAAWCDKIAAELEAKEYQSYLDSGHA